MRIVAGRYKGAALAAPKSQDTRPTSDRLRETIFNILAHGLDVDLDGARVLDLFAGTGALGFEAISRGARHCTFIEEGAEARGAIRRNMETLGLNGAAKIFRRDAVRLGSAGTIEPFDLVFADPPYGKGLGEKALASAAAGGWLKPGAVCVLEERASADIEIPDGFSGLDRRKTGDSQVVFLSFGTPATDLPAA
ncbi:16S rRNA (guanine(966)-N(2))-methyltransferase RsmD [Roseibium salinum]|uniref:16S rRNA (Guanine(966)-N(2))-methyltransferase RsmD n=1 Tax=Roseibium salinum TaxID=1604349 RepID=A0ABT3R3Z9_9HYPH|nr:16S rRNA (guanine(966)-N(2))-methyltransferase RsmD [Roseibium sp. DSM 29163]MCX2723850.1 16S rRNA (guanine(966)-N(2))-methyltransferase RsmD [Roseibium sp. DSM 29163]MDN3718328.1 16S rRNA (guanine(966)-N(2))-methyltransferase RsmD [Roseibium salinum]